MTLLNNLKTETNYDYTENGAVKHKTTESALLDMFALCGAYRKRSEDDCILAFQKALAENEKYAMKCLFYLRDVRGGQGERRFFKVCMRWLANKHPEIALRNLELVPEYGRWDDLYCFIDTKVEKDAFEFMKKQLMLDMECKTPSLMAKWLKSENASSKETKRLAEITRIKFGMSHKQYRKILSMLRERINIVETLMSSNRWDEIEFDKIPSKAGLIYKNAFARRDIIAKKYEEFAKSEDTKVNAGTLNPVEIAHEVYKHHGIWNGNVTITETDRLMLQKYWDNLKDYYNGREENGLAIVDTSGSMYGQPLEAAVSMGAYVAERGHGPFANHFITFSDEPELVEFEGVDIYDKFIRARSANWDGSTNIEAVFDLLLSTLVKHHSTQEDVPTTLYIFSDMEFNHCMYLPDIKEQNQSFWGYSYSEEAVRAGMATLIEKVAIKWDNYGYKLPRIIFWNLDARSQNIPAIGDGFSYVSGFSMNMVDCILSGRDGYDLMMDKLNSERYSAVQ